MPGSECEGYVGFVDVVDLVVVETGKPCFVEYVVNEFVEFAIPLSFCEVFGDGVFEVFADALVLDDGGGECLEAEEGDGGRVAGFEGCQHFFSGEVGMVFFNEV